MACAAWSSERMNTTLGRPATGAGFGSGEGLLQATAADKQAATKIGRRVMYCGLSFCFLDSYRERWRAALSCSRAPGTALTVEGTTPKIALNVKRMPWKDSFLEDTC